MLEPRTREVGNYPKDGNGWGWKGGERTSEERSGKETVDTSPVPQGKPEEHRSLGQNEKRGNTPSGQRGRVGDPTQTWT